MEIKHRVNALGVFPSHKTEKQLLKEDLDVEITVTNNPFDFQLSDLFEMGIRINPKRSFLFISKLLGKHLEVHPDIPKVAGHLLANVFLNKEENHYFSDVKTLADKVKGIDIEIKNELDKSVSLKSKPLFIGFAETATGLGHAVASAFIGTTYVHTTREEFEDKISIFNFEEEHSHATSHLCYLEDKELLNTIDHIILIDDEITTGNTCLNLIQSINEYYPNKRYTVLTLLDWRSKEDENAYSTFETKNNLQINVLSVLKGRIDVISEPSMDFLISKRNKLEELQKEQIQNINNKPKISIINKSFPKMKKTKQSFYAGRFGVVFNETRKIELIAKDVGENLKNCIKGNKTLCIGNGEFIYIPSRVTSYMGDRVSFKSSTRSPIFVDQDSVIKNSIQYEINEDVINYMYNIKGYDEVFIFFEEKPTDKLIEIISNALGLIGVEYINFVIL